MRRAWPRGAKRIWAVRPKASCSGRPPDPRDRHTAGRRARGRGGVRPAGRGSPRAPRYSAGCSIPDIPVRSRWPARHRSVTTRPPPRLTSRAGPLPGLRPHRSALRGSARATGAPGSPARTSALAGARAVVGSLEPRPGRAVALARGPGRGPEPGGGPGWLDAAAQAARQMLQDDQDQPVIGHCDWITDNLRWNGVRLLVAYDWDSLIADSEAIIAGLAAAIYLYPALPTRPRPASSSTPTPPPADGPSAPASYSAAGPQASGRGPSTPNSSTPPDSRSPD